MVAQRKKTYGFHPLAAFADHGAAGTGEALAIMLRPATPGPAPRPLTSPGRRLHYSVGMTITEDMQEAIGQLPDRIWEPAYDTGGQVRPGAWAAEITGLLDLCFATDTKHGQLADLELRHRRRARCEDRIRAARHGQTPKKATRAAVSPPHQDRETSRLRSAIRKAEGPLDFGAALRLVLIDSYPALQHFARAVTTGQNCRTLRFVRLRGTHATRRM
jgi:hypothetical protein